MCKMSQSFVNSLRQQLTAYLNAQRPNRKCPSLNLARPANGQYRRRCALCKAMQVLLTQYCPMPLYLGHLVRQCNWAGENAKTGLFASEGLQIVMCLVDRLNMGDTLLKYERKVATAFLCHTPWLLARLKILCYTNISLIVANCDFFP